MYRFHFQEEICLILTHRLLGFLFEPKNKRSFSDMSVNIYQSAWCHVPEDCILHNKRHENLISNILFLFVTLKKGKAIPVTGRGAP
jgi:hypothetical protein